MKTVTMPSKFTTMREVTAIEIWFSERLNGRPDRKVVAPIYATEKTIIIGNAE